jgi:hypothetical protein
MLSLHIVALQDVVENRMSVLDDGRFWVLSQPMQISCVLPENRVHECVQEQVGAGDAQVVQEMLHASASSTGEGAVSQRFILGALLSNHHHLHGIILQAAAVKHRTEMPSECLSVKYGFTQLAIIGRFSK